MGSNNNNDNTLLGDLGKSFGCILTILAFSGGVFKGLLFLEPIINIHILTNSFALLVLIITFYNYSKSLTNNRNLEDEKSEAEESNSELLTKNNTFESKIAELEKKNEKLLEKYEKHVEVLKDALNTVKMDYRILLASKDNINNAVQESRTTISIGRDGKIIIDKE